MTLFAVGCYMFIVIFFLFYVQIHCNFLKKSYNDIEIIFTKVFYAKLWLYLGLLMGFCIKTIVEVEQTSLDHSTVHGQ